MSEVNIGSNDYWCKVVGFLQQNWALVERDDEGDACTVYFIGDTSGIFDRLAFDSEQEASVALLRNGFSRFATAPSLQEMVKPPVAPFHEQPHPNGPIYSSGRFWK